MSDLAIRLEALDKALAKKFFPRLSPWWRETFTRFLASSKRQCVLRVGRRGGKSSSLCRLAVLICLYGRHRIPPGDIGIVGIVSVSVNEARARLRTIKAILDALGIAYKPVDGGIELEGRPIAFKVFAATTSGVVGGTWIAALCDEVAGWRDADTGANPASIVLGKLRPCLATTKGPIFLSSSPEGTDDAHAKAFDAGPTDFQFVASAPTWIANTTLTEDELRREEPNPAVFNREYGAIPSTGAIGAFVGFKRCITSPKLLTTITPPTFLIDFAGAAGSGAPGKRDAATCAAATWCSFATDIKPWRHDASGEPEINPEYSREPTTRLAIYSMNAIGGDELTTMSAHEAIERMARIARDVGASLVIADQYQSYFLEGELRKHGLDFRSIPWTNARKSDAVRTLRRWFRDRAIAIVEGPEVPALEAELATFEEDVSRGVTTFNARRGSHDDRVALLLNAAMAESEGLLTGSPHRHASERHEEHDWRDPNEDYAA